MKRPLAKPCAAFRCDTATTRGLAMCHTHWTRLPLALRQTITRTARAEPFNPVTYETAIRAGILVLAAEDGIPATDVVFSPCADPRRPRPEGLQMDLFAGAQP